MNIELKLVPLNQKEAVAMIDQGIIYYLNSENVLTELTDASLKDSIYTAKGYYLQKIEDYTKHVISYLGRCYGNIGDTVSYYDKVNARSWCSFRVGDILSIGNETGLVVGSDGYSVLIGDELYDLRSIIERKPTLKISHKDINELDLCKINKHLRISIID